MMSNSDYFLIIGAIWMAPHMEEKWGIFIGVVYALIGLALMVFK